MTDNTLDKIFLVPELEELKAEKVNELQQKGFVITNFNTGGVFNMLLVITLQLYVEFRTLLRTVLKQMYVSSATGVWLQERGNDYSKTIKEARKARGNMMIRAEAEHETITIPKGTVFKTEKDITGQELRFFSLADVMLMKTDQSVEVEVEAEKPGTDYNVPAGKICRTLTHLDGITAVENTENWLLEEGTDLEDDELFRSRILNSWSELAAAPTAAKYKSIAESVNGVMYAEVDQLHPRGQGTVDIIITGTAGAASDALLEQVGTALEAVKGDYDNLLVKSATVVTQNIMVEIIMPALVETEGIAGRAESAIEHYFRINTSRNLNELIILDILYQTKQEIPEAKNIRILSPKEDICLGTGQVIVLGTLDIEVIQEKRDV